MFGDQITKQLVQARARQLLEDQRDGIYGAEGYYQWLAAQTDAELGTGAGGLQFTGGDIVFLRSAFADQHDLYLRYVGQAATIAQPYDYRVNAKQLIGP